MEFEGLVYIPPLVIRNPCTWWVPGSYGPRPQMASVDWLKFALVQDGAHVWNAWHIHHFSMVLSQESRLHLFVLCAYLPPASAVEVIESEPCVCVCVCVSVTSHYDVWSHNKFWGERTSKFPTREVHECSGVFIMCVNSNWPAGLHVLQGFPS